MNETVIETLERLYHHYEALMQEWSIKNGEPGTSTIHGVELGYADEVRALRAAIDAIREHGVPTPRVEVRTNLHG
jgi:2-phospho-L-lactate transferase/gluconeogenesis factor (CofD/UPF0052 family)